MMRTVKSLLREEGIVAMWRGNAPAFALWTSFAAIQFPVHQFVRDDVLAGRANKDVASFLGGAAGGLAATIATYPFDFLRTRYAFQGIPKIYASYYHLITSTYASEGVAGFYRGVTPTAISIMPVIGFTFSFYDVLLRSLKAAAGTIDAKSDSATSILGHMPSLFAGTLAGAAAKFLVYPLDTVKKRFQVQGVARHASYGPSVPAYTSIRSCLSTMIATEGFLSLYKGLATSMLKVGVSSGITLFVYEVLMDKHDCFTDSAGSPNGGV